MLKKIILFIACAFLMLNTIAALADQVFYDTNGNAVKLSNLKGRWVVINYWASWCSACQEEVPELNLFYEKIKNTNVVFYGVSYDELSPSDLKASIASIGIDFPVLTSDPGPAWNLDSVDVIPTTFIINPKGQVVKVISGTTTERSLLNTISALEEGKE